MRHQPPLAAAALLALAVLLSGCVSFTGPNDVRAAIAKQEDVRLEKEMGVTVGPLGVFLANTLAGPWIPVNVDGLDWVSYGEYVCHRNEPSAQPLSFRDITLPGYERVARVCDRGEDVIVLVSDKGKRLRRIVVIIREKDTVRIASVEGNLDKVIDRLLDSDFIDMRLDFLDDGSEETEVVAEVTMTADAAGAWAWHLRTMSRMNFSPVP
jgi:hypothetical protein